MEKSNEKTRQVGCALSHVSGDFGNGGCSELEEPERRKNLNTWGMIRFGGPQDIRSWKASSNHSGEMSDIQRNT